MSDSRIRPYMIEKIISTKTLHKGKFLDFIEDQIEIEVEPVIKSSRQYFTHPGGVCILPIIGDQIALIKQYRTPVQKIIYEIPAGKLDSGEQPFDAAKRELQEETGYSAGKWTDLGFIYPCPGYSTERLYVYLAQDLDAGAQNLDHGEIVELELMTIAQVTEMIQQGRIPDAKTIAALFLAQQYL